VKFLIEKGADVNERVKYSNSTPLTIATMEGHQEIARILIQCISFALLAQTCPKPNLHFYSVPGYV